MALLGIQSGSVALTLTTVAIVWFAELTWSPPELLQADGQVHGMGQASAQVTNLYFIAKGTFEEDLWHLIERKYKELGKFDDGQDHAKVIINNKFTSLLEIVSESFPSSYLRG